MLHLLYGLLLYFFFNWQPENPKTRMTYKFHVNFYTVGRRSSAGWALDWLWPVRTGFLLITCPHTHLPQAHTAAHTTTTSANNLDFAQFPFLPTLSVLFTLHSLKFFIIGFPASKAHFLWPVSDQRVAGCMSKGFYSWRVQTKAFATHPNPNPKPKHQSPTQGAHPWSFYVFFLFVGSRRRWRARRAT